MSSKKIAIACQICKSKNYSFFKKSTIEKERLVLKKFCKKCGFRTIHKEEK